MSQWGRPRHRTIRHNQRVRGGGTWSDQDRRLKRHQVGRMRRKKGGPDTWTSEVRHLQQRQPFGARLVAGIVTLGAGVAAVAAGGRVLLVFAAVVVVTLAWRKVRPR